MTHYLYEHLCYDIIKQTEDDIGCAKNKTMVNPLTTKRITEKVI